MAKIIVGIAIAGFIIADFMTAGALTPFLPALTAATSSALTTMGVVMAGIGLTGAGLLINGISDALFHTQGSAVASRNPVSPWQVVYGQQMLGGTMVDIAETGEDNKFLHMIIVVSCHQMQSFDGLWLDGKQVFFGGDVLSGAYDDGVSHSLFDWPLGVGQHYDQSGLPYNFRGRVYCQAFLGTPTQTACQEYINKSNGHWTSNHRLQGRAYIYLQLAYNTDVFPSGPPQVKTLWHGKKDILDPRDGQRKYTTNAALCINDYLTNQDFGLRCATTEVNQTQLIAAANLCDSYTQTGTIEPLYSLNGVFNLQATPGEVLNNMLSACGGQISYNAGQFSIYPASWRGATVTMDQTDLLAPIKYTPKRKKRELFNCVRGTFLSPFGPIQTRGPGVQTGQINPWDGQWTYTDIPEYAEDVSHGYVSDAFRTADGETLFCNTKFPFTTSVSTCQRLAKLILERNRQQGSGTLTCSLGAWVVQPLDIIQFNYPRFGWVDKLFEVTGTKLTIKAENGKAPVPVVELSIQETDPRVYSWAGEEEHNLAGQAGPLVPSSFTVPPPTGLTLTDDESTAVALPDGTTAARLLIQWTAPPDPYVTAGGTIQIQYQLAAGQVTDWVNSGSVQGDANYKYLDGIATNTLINVRIRSVRPSGAYSFWVEASRNATNIGIPGPVTSLSATESPYKTEGGMKSLVSVSFVPPAQFFGSAEVYFTYYNGCATPQLMSSGTTSPIEFICDTTHETVRIDVLSRSLNNITSDENNTPYCWVSLDGVASAPPMPSIAKAQSPLPDGTGWQFSVNVLGGFEADQIAGYRVYHSENAGTTSPDYYTTLLQPPTNVGSVTCQEVTGDLLWYWVSAISTSGMESVLNSVPFQYVDPGAAPPSSLTPVTTTSVYKPSVILNGWSAGAHKGYYENQDLTSGTNNFGNGNQTYNAFSNTGNAFDGNQATSASFNGTHTGRYAGVVYSFTGNTFPAGATVTDVKLNVVSDVQATSGINGEAGVYYSIDGGTNWTVVYVQNSHGAGYGTGTGTRWKKTDTVSLPTNVTPANIQVLCFGHSHDDIAINIYELNLTVASSSYAGPEKVTGVSAKLVSNNVQISWNGLIPLTRSDLISYQVYRATHGAGYTLSHLQQTVTPNGSATYSWTDVQAHDGSFDYWVVAQNNAGWGPASDVAFIASAGSLLYSNNKTAQDLMPAEAGAQVVTGKSIDILTDGTYARTKAAGLTNGGVNFASATHAGILPYGNHAGAVTTAINSSGNVQNLNGTAAATVLANITAAQTAATAAQGDATTALTNAATANTAIGNISSDNVLSPVEKSAIILNKAAVDGEKADIDSKASNYGISAVNYDNAYNELGRYLGAAKSGTDGVGTGGTDWSNMGTNSAIDGPTFRSKWSDLYTKRQLLLNSIAAQAKVLADAAQSTANTGVANAATAQAAANTAQTTANTAVTNAATAQTAANTANTAIGNISSDNMLSKGEKSQVIMDKAAVDGEKADIDSKATTYGVSAATYDAAYTELGRYLGAAKSGNDGVGTGGTDWSNTGTDSAIDGATFRSKWSDLYTKRQLLLNAIAAQAKVLADAAQSTANTANTAAGTAQSTANTANTNANMANTGVTNLTNGTTTAGKIDFNSGAHLNKGGYQNTSIAVSGGVITGIGTGSGTAVDNGAISIGSNGALSGAGGGQVTIGGLGYGGEMNANNTAGHIVTSAITSNSVQPTGGPGGHPFSSGQNGSGGGTSSGSTVTSSSGTAFTSAWVGTGLSAKYLAFTNGGATTVGRIVSVIDSTHCVVDVTIGTNTMGTWKVYSPMGWTLTASGTSDVYNIYVGASVLGNLTDFTVGVSIDDAAAVQNATFNNLDASGLAYFASVTGLSAGTHTITPVISGGGSASANMAIQRIF